MRWEKPVRVVVAVVGIATAVVIYRAMQPRPAASPAAVVRRLDPRSSVESTGAILQQVRGAEEDFELTHDRALSYADGSTKQFGVRISVRGRGGRDYVVTAAQASAGAGARNLELSGQVSLVASDGFSLTTESAVFERDAGVVRAPGPVSFSRGRMVGHGVGMTYDQNADILHVLSMPTVTLSGPDESVASSFTAGTAVLDRTQNFLRLDGQSHVAHGEQAFDSDITTAHLTDDEQFVTLLELRGHARVGGGAGALESMSARDINMVYTDDGAALERVALNGTGVVVLKPEAGDRGRTVAGEALDLTLGPDGALASALGRGGVRLETPGASGRAARVVRSTSFQASGAAGAGLTDARFVGDVEYREEGGGPAKGRVARSRTLDLGLQGEGVRSAAFEGEVTFEESGGVRARAATMQYVPQSGALLLSGRDAGGGPRVADERMTIEAEGIDASLEDRRMTARGAVKTTVAAAGTGSVRRSGSDDSNSADSRSANSGLLDRGRPINVNADVLSSSASGETITYTGDATLWQGDVAIRADRITLDEDTGDVTAAGQARSTLPLDGSTMVGRAAQIRYTSATRVVVYDARDAASSSGRGPGATAKAVTAAVTDASLAQLTGTHGDVQGQRIEIVLGPGRGSVDRVEAYRDVAMALQARRARGARLTYHAAEQRYVLTGTATAPVSVVDACRAITGKTLTFFRSTDRILVDGDREIRTRTTSDGPCEPAGAR